MRKRLLSIAASVLMTMPLLAQQAEIKIATATAKGETFAMWPKSISKETPIVVDWGDGVEKSYNIDPEGYDYETKVEGVVAGDTIRIKTQLTKLDISEAGVVYLSMTNQPLLTVLTANKNQLTYSSLDLSGATALEQINLSDNNLSLLNLSAMKQLVTVQANNNPELGSVLFPNDCETLTSISMNNCDISHFYSVNLPNLSELSLENCSLMDMELGENYPKLASLNLNGNYLQEIDVTTLPKLYDLAIGKNFIREIDLRQNPELNQLSVTGNQLNKLNVSANKNLTALYCANNHLTELDVTELSKLTKLACDSNQIKRLDLSNAQYLKTLSASGCDLEFLDFSANYFALDNIDIRGNKRFTPQALNYMYGTMPARSRNVWSANCKIAGSNGETSNTDMINNEDMKWKTDVTGDGTAPMDSVSVTVETVQGGTMTLLQPNEQGKEWTAVTTKVIPGRPIKVVAAPNADFALKSISINGTEISDSLFVVTTDAVVIPQFVSTVVPTITLQVEPETKQQYILAAAEENSEVSIDWGNGETSTVILGTKSQTVEGTTAGTTVTIKGAVTKADFSSYPGIGTDNKIKAIDLSKNNNLTHLGLFFNQLSSIDVSQQSKLTQLDVAYNFSLENLDVSNNPLLDTLYCSSTSIRTLNLNNNANLKYLDTKGTQLSYIDLTNNKMLESLMVQSCQLSSLDVSHQTELVSLNAGGNHLTSINLANNKKLKELFLDSNVLYDLDLTQNEQLFKLNVADNQLNTLDLSNQKLLYWLDCSNNGWDACTLNDVYFSLNNYPTLDTPLQGYTLKVKGTKTPNDADHAESIIAKGKGWKIDYEGDGSGCEESYIKLETSAGGTASMVDMTGMTVYSGTKVLKGTDVTLKVTPDEGMAATEITRNGVTMQHYTFTVNGYTEIVVKFSVDTHVNGVGTEKATFESVQGGIEIKTPSALSVQVYTQSGNMVYNGNVESNTKVTLQSGIYVVKVSNGTQTTVRKILVQ